MSKAKELMMSALPAERRMEAALRRYERCKSLAEKVTSSMGNETVSRTRDVTSHETSIIALMEAQEEVDRCFAAYAAAEGRIYDKLALIEQIPAKVLEQYYLKHMTISQISDDGCHSRTWTYSRLNEGLTALEAILN